MGRRKKTVDGAAATPTASAGSKASAKTPAQPATEAEAKAMARALQRRLRRQAKAAEAAAAAAAGLSTPSSSTPNLAGASTPASASASSSNLASSTNNLPTMSDEPKAPESVLPCVQSSSSIVILHPGSMHVRIGFADSTRPLEQRHVIARLRSRVSDAAAAARRSVVDSYTVTKNTRKHLTIATPADVAVSARPVAPPPELPSIDGQNGNGTSAMMVVAPPTPVSAPAAVVLEDDDEPEPEPARNAESSLAASQLPSNLDTVTSAIHAELCRQFDPTIRRRATGAPPVATGLKATIPEEQDDGYSYGPKFQWTARTVKPSFIVGEEALGVDPELYDICWPIKNGMLDGTRPIRIVYSDLYDIWWSLIKNQLKLSKADVTKHGVVLVISDIYRTHEVQEMVRLLLNDIGFGAIFLVQESVASAMGSGLTSACVVDIGHDKTSISCVEEGVCLRNTRLHLNYGGGDIERALQYLLAQGRWKHWPSTSSSAPKWQPPFKFEMTDIQHRTIVREFKEKLCHLDTSDEWEQTFEFALRTKGQPTAVYQMDAPRELLFVPPLCLYYPELFAFFEGEDRKPLILELKSNHKDKKATEMKPLYFVERNGMIPLDEAIIHSVRRSSNKLELIRKLFSTIIVVGGTARLRGFSEFLKHTINTKNAEYLEGITAEVLPPPRDIDPAYLSWRGAGVIAFLECCKEWWIGQEEWNQHGEPLLQQRVPFKW